MNGVLTKRRFSFVLLLITAIAAIPRIWLGAVQYVEYDGYWHVFVAGQDRWENFWWDVGSNAHPPLFFLLLRFMLLFGHSPLIYRTVSIATGVASVWLLGRIAERVMISRVWAAVAALAFALALPAIVIACEVRSYMLCVFFVLFSFRHFLEVIAPEGGRAKVAARVAFAALAIGACLSHYFAFFYVGACALALLARSITRMRAFFADLAIVLPIVAVMYILYAAHAHKLAVIQGHLVEFYFDPRRSEHIGAFFIRNWWNFFNLFWPYAPAGRTVALIGLAVGVLTAIALLAVLFRERTIVDARAGHTLAVTILMLGSIVAAAIAGKYPFGGDLRQQFLLFPFLILGAAIAIDRALSSGRARLQILYAVAAIVWIVAVSWLRLAQLPKTSTPVVADRMEKFDSIFPDPTAIYMDQWNLIAFFQFHDTWKWTFVDHDPAVKGVDVYRLTKGDRRLTVFRNKVAWNFRPEDDGVFQALSAFLRRGEAPRVTLFCMLQTPPAASRAEVWRAVKTMSDNSGICADRQDLSSINWFARFRTAPCTWAQPPAPRLAGVFDAHSDEIEYAGYWLLANYIPPGEGNFSIATASGARATLAFEGKVLQWSYRAAPNAGMAEVRIDGEDRGTVDQYSPQIVKHAAAVFDNLAAGRHTFEISVLGRKRAASNDTVVDIDRLTVH